MFKLCYLPPNFGISIVGNLTLGANQLPFPCVALGFCDSAELTSLALLSSEIILAILALISQYASVTASIIRVHVYGIWQTLSLFLNARHSCLDRSSFSD